jgi:surface antigen
MTQASAAMRSVLTFKCTSTLVAVCAILAFATPSLAAAVGNGFAGAARGLNALDVTLLEQAVRQALDTQKQGESAVWEDRESGQAGRATVLRVYEQNGMRCAEIEHVITTGNANRYVVPYCRIVSGEWRIAF